MTNKDVMDPFGLLDEPTAEELQEFKDSGYYSMNPYLLIGWLVYNRKKKLEEQLPEEFQTDTH